MESYLLGKPKSTFITFKTRDLESFWNHVYELDYLSCPGCKRFHSTAVFCG